MSFLRNRPGALHPAWGLLAATLAASPLQALEGEVSWQSRLHPQSSARAADKASDNSAALLLEWYRESEDRRFSVQASPFIRVAAEVGSRSHADLRELYWNGVFEDIELRLGISKVFWGKTELLHLVDIINQDDNLENLDGEDKLGQAMLRASYRIPNGQLIAYLLPRFRERAFVDADSRFGTPLPVAEERAIYESSQGRDHLDWALRWEGYVGGLDFGWAHFSGTARDPELILDNPQAPTALLPVYAQLAQSSLDAQYIWGGWLFKLEALYRDTALLESAGPGELQFAAQSYAAATGGFEYTLYGVGGSSADLGLLTEYLWDERGAQAPVVFQNDLFVGGRLALNDVAGSTLLAGAVFDLDRGGAFISVEASRRLGDSTALALEARLFTGIDPQDTLFFPIRNDDYLQLELTRYF